MRKQWNLQPLAIEMRKDLAKCTTESERQLCKAICEREIRDTARAIQTTRKLGPAEMAILEDVN